MFRWTPVRWLVQVKILSVSFSVIELMGCYPKLALSRDFSSCSAGAEKSVVKILTVKILCV